MQLILIAAMDTNRVIGFKNKIPWHIPEEIRHFKESTMGHGVIMGRKTFDSIGAALPGRQNVVISTNRKLSHPGCQIAHSLAEALACCKKQKKVFIIGGRGIFQEAMNQADTILLSIIHKTYEGDTLFPAIPAEDFQLLSEKQMGTDPLFTLQTYQRKTVS
jgi:dihydrofolate reductase